MYIYTYTNLHLNLLCNGWKKHHEEITRMIEFFCCYQLARNLMCVNTVLVFLESLLNS